MITDQVGTIDPYKALQLHPRASRMLVEEAYWVLVEAARRVPSVARAEAQMRKLNDAYSLLADPERRREYDDAHGLADLLESEDIGRRSKRDKQRNGPFTRPGGINYYELLRVDRGASPAIIDLAFRIRSHELRNTGADAPVLSHQLVEARTVLIDPALRAVYDSGLGRPPGNHSANGPSAAVAPPPERAPGSPPPVPLAPPLRETPPPSSAPQPDAAAPSSQEPAKAPARRSKRRAPKKAQPSPAEAAPPATNGAPPADAPPKPRGRKRKSPPPDGSAPATGRRKRKTPPEPAPDGQQEPRPKSRSSRSRKTALVAEAEALVSELQAERRRWAARGLPRDVLVEHSILPIDVQVGRRTVAIPPFEDPEVVREQLRNYGVEADVTTAPYAQIRQGLTEIFKDQDRRRIVWDHAERHPELSANRILTTTQKVVGLGALGATALSLLIAPVATLIALIGVAMLIYFVAIIYKCLLVGRALATTCEQRFTPAQVAALADEDLPAYTLLVPLYREANVLPELMLSLDRLDYPKDRLDVKLLLEEDDKETREAAERLRLPPYVHVMIVPPDGPRGKPKACNYGLAHARGDFVVLYDAEDRPEADQLKKAVLAFRTAGADVACVQAKLNYYNPEHNLLTRWFTAEYSTWFDLYLPGLNSYRAPIPLGGTSNHFRVDLLRAAGGWDPFNVTEDADLGIRLARYGYRTEVVDSVTLEEANSRLVNWLRQRSRWIKGYMLTWLVHMRNPRQLVRDVGWGGFIAFHVMVFGTFWAYFVNPIFWALMAAWYITHWSGIHALFPAPVLYMSAASFFGGNFLYLFGALIGCLRRGFYSGVKYALITPIYWALMSVAAWKALYQLIVKPYFWEKTEHGFVPPVS